MADTLRAFAPADPLQGRHHKPGAGLTVQDCARRYRVSPDKIRTWIDRGELKAINTATAKCGKPRWAILPECCIEFERNRAGGPAPKSARRRAKSALTVDHFPD